MTWFFCHPISIRFAIHSRVKTIHLFSIINQYLLLTACRSLIKINETREGIVKQSNPHLLVMDGRSPAITSLEKNGILETAEHKLI